MKSGTQCCSTAPLGASAARVGRLPSTDQFDAHASAEAAVKLKASKQGAERHSSSPNTSIVLVPQSEVLRLDLLLRLLEGETPHVYTNHEKPRMHAGGPIETTSFRIPVRCRSRKP